MSLHHNTRPGPRTLNASWNWRLASLNSGVVNDSRGSSCLRYCARRAVWARISCRRGHRNTRRKSQLLRFALSFALAVSAACPAGLPRRGGHARDRAGRDRVPPCLEERHLLLVVGVHPPFKLWTRRTQPQSVVSKRRGARRRRCAAGGAERAGGYTDSRTPPCAREPPSAAPTRISRAPFSLAASAAAASGPPLYRPSAIECAGESKIVFSRQHTKNCRESHGDGRCAGPELGRGGDDARRVAESQAVHACYGVQLLWVFCARRRAPGAPSAASKTSSASQRHETTVSWRAGLRRALYCSQALAEEGCLPAKVCGSSSGSSIAALYVRPRRVARLALRLCADRASDCASPLLS